MVNFPEGDSVLLCVILCGCIIWILRTRRASSTGIAAFWDSLDWIQDYGQFLFWPRAHIGSMFKLQDFVREGYDKYSKRGLVYGITTLFSGPMVMLPQDVVQYILNQPEHVIDGYTSQNETIQAWYTISDPQVYMNNFHFKIVRNQLTRNIASFSENIAHELQLGLECHWGDSEYWKTIEIWDFCMQVISRAANRVFVGPELCRNDDFLEQARLYAKSIFGGALIIRMFPTWMHPAIGRLVGFKVKWHKWKVNSAILPVVIERLKYSQEKRVKPDCDWTAPDDGLQWLIEECFKTGDTIQLDPRLVVNRLLILNMVAMHSTSFTIANVILDLFSAPDAEKIVSMIRKEVDCALTASNGVWNKETVAKLHCVDSTIRESMRMSGFGVAAMPRLVSKPEGIKIGGQHIPKGTKLAIAMHEIHFDERFYKHPEIFRPFRFGMERDMKSTKGVKRELEGPGMRDLTHGEIVTNLSEGSSKEVGATAVSDVFLPFGYGRHACPGRFFAVHEMKILLALILQHYDVEYLSQRPKDQTFVEVKLPSEKSTVRIRRRRSE